MSDGHTMTPGQPDEPARLQALRRLELLDTPPEEPFERITRLARDLFAVPIVLVSLVDEDRQWFKSCIGLDDRETGLDRSFCARAILSDEVLVVPDAERDPRFASNPAVLEAPSVRFYAGVPLKAREGYRIGTLCIIDTQPRQLTPDEILPLKELAATVETIIELRAAALEAERQSVRLGQLAAIVENSEDAILTKSLDGTIRSWNPAAEEIYGYRAEEVVGGSISVLLPEGYENDVTTVLQRVAAGERVEHYETKRKTRTGDIIDVSLSTSPLRDESGNVVGAGTIARDITEARKLQAELAEREALLSAIYETSPDVIAVVTPELQTRYVNPAAQRILGYEPGQFMGPDSLEIVHPDDIPASVKLLQAAFGDGGGDSARVRVKAADGRWVWLDLRIRRMGTSDEAVVMARDVSEQVKLEEGLHEAREQAERANLSKSEFLSRMSHELRTPLNAILGFGQLLQMEDLTPDQGDGVEQIIKGGHRLLELINEVLDISRIESGTLPLSLEPILVEEVVRDAVELIRPLANERGIALRADLPAEAADSYVVADKQRLGQVLLNLLSNGVKYNVQEGTVSVTALRDADAVRIGVTDTGPGIPEDKIPLLFTPFERLGADQTTVEGTGLGLALSKSLVEAMAGSLRVDTMAGQGTTLWVELPTSREPLHDADAEDIRPAPQPNGTMGRILYIEDNLSNLRLIERLVRHRPDVELIPAMTGALGMELAQQHIPSLIVLDLHLPDLTGDEVLLRLRKDPRTQAIRVVVLSADATPGRIERLRAAGANEYLTKPIDVVQFMALMDRLLGSEGHDDG